MRVFVTLTCLSVLFAVGCTCPSVPPKTAFSNVYLVFEPQLGRIRLPNVTDHKFMAKLKMRNDDFFSVLDVTVKDKGDDREFGFTVMHRIGDEEKGLADIVKYSELPKKYLQVGKWTVWVKREDQLK